MLYGTANGTTKNRRAGGNQKPTINVVKLQHQTHILAGSGPDTLQGHAKSGEETEDTWYDLE